MITEPIDGSSDTMGTPSRPFGVYTLVRFRRLDQEPSQRHAA
jgi:hypothetical protein